MTGRPVTWRVLWQQTTEVVGDRASARWLCEVAASAISGDEFVTRLDETPTERMVAHLDDMLARLHLGEPLQYVLGQWSFRRVELAIDRRVLIPRPETELVAEVAADLARAFGPIRTIADLGTGSGAIGLALADELPLDGTTVWLTDVDREALDVARANAAGIGMAGRNVRIVEGAWFDALDAGARFDVIVSNPPYVAENSGDLERVVAEWEPAGALFAGPDGLDAYRVLVPAAIGHLRPGGALVLEIGADQAPAIDELLRRHRYTDVEIRPDLAGRDRIAVARRPVDVATQGSLRVRRMRNTLDDYTLLVRWLGEPHVGEWYSGRDRVHDLASVLAEYGPGGDHEREGTECAIVEWAGRPVGYVQVYELTLCAEEFGLEDGRGIWSLDLFIGEPDQLGRGIGRTMVDTVTRYLLEERDAIDVVIMTWPENERARSAYRAAGFVEESVVPDHETHEGRMRDGLRLRFRGR